MAFRTFEGKLLYTLHFPNTAQKEHPIFLPLSSLTEA